KRPDETAQRSTSRGRAATDLTPHLADPMPPIKHHRENTNVVQFRGRGVRAQLREALEARAPIRVLREKISPNWVHGHILGFSAQFFLIAGGSGSLRFERVFLAR